MIAAPFARKRACLSCSVFLLGGKGGTFTAIATTPPSRTTSPRSRYTSPLISTRIDYHSLQNMSFTFPGTPLARSAPTNVRDLRGAERLCGAQAPRWRRGEVDLLKLYCGTITFNCASSRTYHPCATLRGDLYRVVLSLPGNERKSYSRGITGVFKRCVVVR